MYWEFSTLLVGQNTDSDDRASVLAKLPPESAKEVVVNVVKNIVQTLGISQPPQLSPFQTDNEVEWCLQVVCFGLSLPLTDHEVIKDCVNIYCEWLSCLAPNVKISVPKPLTERPAFYSRKIIRHLYHLFTPRKGEGQDLINRQAVLCHRVLRTIQIVIRSSTALDNETWECILLFLISINDSLLSPPSLREDIGDQLCDRVLGVLFEIWLLSCEKSFPSPSLWKTLREACKSWRHRPNLFEQWNRINLLLTGKTLAIMYGPEYYKIIDDETHFSIGEMSPDCIVQTWFRFLHCVGNPVELTKPTVISQTQSFLQYAIASDSVIDPCQHPCLSVLPSIFNQAMKGISALVDAFLGFPIKKKLGSLTLPVIHQPIQSPTQPVRRLAKSFSIAPSSNIYKGLPRNSIFGLPIRSKDTSSIPSSSQSSLQSTNSVQIQQNPTVELNGFSHLPSGSRPKVNSILHLFGPWLFEAALISCDSYKQAGDNRRQSRSGSINIALPENIEIPMSIIITNYYLGRAEALGTLCRIFCSKKSGEEILPCYLARFYMAIREGLKETITEVLSAILLNSANILRVDLDGVSLLIPDILRALEAILPSKDSLKTELRRSAIAILLSLLSFPLHYLNVPIKDLLDKSKHVTMFIHLKPRLANLLINSLQAEVDSTNIQMLLGGLMMFVSDQAAFEEVDKSYRPVESPTNILSSESASIRSYDYSTSVSFEEPLGGISEDNQPDTAHSLFVRAIYLACHRLISNWKSDLQVTLATFELLCGLARLKIQDRDPAESKRAVKWICDFIVHQCSRPPPHHSKDLHSSIVAAFHCLSAWLMAHSFILEDRESLNTILEVVEYGISGTKSLKPGEAPKLKDEKELKPISLRVRDVAEQLLSVIFEQVGNPYPVNDIAAVNVDELYLYKQITSEEKVSKSDSIRHFRYFVIDRSILIALIEESQIDEKEPTLKMIIRSPTARYSWSLNQRYAPKSKNKSFSSANDNNPGRPLPINDLGVKYDIKPRYFPDSVTNIIPCKADKAIPSLESVCLSSDQDALELNRLSIILENQIKGEKRLAQIIKEEIEKNYPNLITECTPPPPVTQNFISSRLFLSSFGFIQIEGDSQTAGGAGGTKLIPIDSKHPDFIEELDALDSISCRTNDTVYIFYVRSGQVKAEEILANVQSKEAVHPHFLEFLSSLGWAVKVDKHSGWTGRVKNQKTSSNQGYGENLPSKEVGKGKNSSVQNENLPTNQHGGCLFDGKKEVLYWSDVSSELAFVVPTELKSPETDETAVWDSKGSSEHGGEKTSTDSSEKHLGDEQNRAKKPPAGKLFDTKVFVVWLEYFEDSFHFPVGDLVKSTYTGLESPGSGPVEPALIIFIHEMANGLLRIHLQATSHHRLGLATPLVEGMVVSRRVLGSLVRQTALNMSRRKRLENENFQPPHVRRKLKIQEILNKFTSVVSRSEFYTQFFCDPSVSPCEKFEQSGQEDYDDDNENVPITV